MDVVRNPNHASGVTSRRWDSGNQRSSCESSINSGVNSKLTRTIDECHNDPEQLMQLVRRRLLGAEGSGSAMRFEQSIRITATRMETCIPHFFVVIRQRDGGTLCRPFLILGIAASPPPVGQLGIDKQLRGFALSAAWDVKIATDWYVKIATDWYVYIYICHLHALSIENGSKGGCLGFAPSKW